MALEVTSSVSVSFDDGVQNSALAVLERQLTSAGLRFSKIVQEVGTTEGTIELGELTSVGAFILVNLDETNFINVKVARAGAIFAKLKPDLNGDGNGGWVAGDCLGSGAQVPYAIADTAPCRMAVFVIEQ